MVKFTDFPTKEHYEHTIVQSLLQIGVLRHYNKKLVSSRKLVEDELLLESEDHICKLWKDAIFDSYHFYDGFATKEQCEQFIHQSHYPSVHFCMVEFGETFYAVNYENTQHQQIIGQDISYFIRNKLFLVGQRPPNNLNLRPLKKLPIVPIIFYEMVTFDPQLKAYRLNEMSQIFERCELKEVLEYIVLLGVTFKDSWYLCNNQQNFNQSKCVLNMYFGEGHDYMLFSKYSNAMAINPFQRLICLPRGRIEHFQMDFDDRSTSHRRLPYAEQKRFTDYIRSRSVNFDEHVIHF